MKKDILFNDLLNWLISEMVQDFVLVYNHYAKSWQHEQQ